MRSQFLIRPVDCEVSGRLAWSVHTFLTLGPSPNGKAFSSVLHDLVCRSGYAMPSLSNVMRIIVSNGFSVSAECREAVTYARLSRKINKVC